MIKKKTIQLAISALRKMRKKVLFDGLLNERGWCHTPHSVLSNKIRRSIEDAILELTEYLEELNDTKNT